LKIGGESALRFDIPTLRLHFFGISIWMEEFFIVLMGVFFVTFLFLLITLLFGRIWCGWLCPQTVLDELTEFINRRKDILSYVFLVLISIFVSANLIWYFVSPYEFIPGLLRLALGRVIWGFWIVLSIIVFLNFAFIRETFCTTVCPYSKAQSALYDDHTMVIAFDSSREEECMHCEACVRICPVGIDIRDGLSEKCINCAKCIDECRHRLKRRDRPSLINYFFGTPEGEKRLFRTNAVLFGSATVAFLGLFLYMLFTRIPFDMTVLPDYKNPPRINERGEVINSYIISIKNMDRNEMAFRLTTETGKIIPSREITLAPDTSKKMRILIIKTSDTNSSIEEIKLTLYNREGISITKTIHFITPEV
jgi:cytochrome c oxidase accessory protein FixG